MTYVALHLLRAGRNLAGSVVCDANDLALAAAGAGAHGGTPVSDDRFRLRTAALAEDFGNGRHQHPSSDSHVPPKGRTCPAYATELRTCGFPDKTCANTRSPSGGSLVRPPLEPLLRLRHPLCGALDVSEADAEPLRDLGWWDVMVLEQRHLESLLQLSPAVLDQWPVERSQEDLSGRLRLVIWHPGA
jgi:hypothetical protein